MQRSSLSLREFIKRQRAEKRAQNSNPVDIISENLPLPLKKLAVAPSSPEEFLTVHSTDGAQFVVPIEMMCKCSPWFLRLFGDNQKQFRENLQHQMDLPFSAAAIEDVIRFCCQDYLLNGGSINTSDAQRIVFQFEIKADVVMELLHASNYFEILPLQRLSSKMLAYYFDEIPSLVGLPPELTMSVLEMLPPLKLGQAEQTPKLTELGIDTSALWQRHCEKNNWNLRNRYIGFYWTNYEPLIDICDVDQFETSDTWKSLFMEMTFLKLAEQIALSNQETKHPNFDSDYDQALKIGPFVRRLTITKRLPAQLLISACANLVSLDVHGGWKVPCESIGITHLTNLRTLTLRAYYIDPSWLNEFLLSAECKLECLCLVDCAIDHQSWESFSLALARCTSLKHLSLNGTALRSACVILKSEDWRNNTTLVTLDLSMCSIRSSFDWNWFRTLSELQSLRHLILSENDIGGFWRSIISVIPRTIVSLVAFDTGLHKVIRDGRDSLDILISGLREFNHTQLEYLNVAYNGLLGSHFSKIVDYANVTGRNLRWLDVSKNEIELSESMSSFVQLLAEHPSLTFIDFHRTKVTSSQLKVLCRTLRARLKTQHAIPMRTIRIDSLLLESGEVLEETTLLEGFGIRFLSSSLEIPEGVKFWKRV